MLIVSACRDMQARPEALPIYCGSKHARADLEPLLLARCAEHVGTILQQQHANQKSEIRFLYLRKGGCRQLLQAIHIQHVKVMRRMTPCKHRPNGEHVVSPRSLQTPVPLSSTHVELFIADFFQLDTPELLRKAMEVPGLHGKLRVRIRIPHLVLWDRVVLKPLQEC